MPPSKADSAPLQRARKAEGAGTWVGATPYPALPRDVRMGSDSEATAASQNGRNQGVRRHGCRRSEPVTPGSVSRQRLDQPRLGRRQQLREQREIVAAGNGELERTMHIDPDHVATRREPQLALAGEQRVPGFVLLPGDQGVLAVGAEAPVGS
jgi:hypothetical protein